MNQSAMPRVLDRLMAATNAHDLGSLASCFAEKVVSETPAHPERNFVGRDQVRLNWAQIFEAVPDITASILRWSDDGSTVWAEWEHRGTRRDGATHDMRGVTIFEIDGREIASVRFFLEPVRRDGLGPTDAVRTLVSSERAR